VALYVNVLTIKPSQSVCNNQTPPKSCLFLFPTFHHALLQKVSHVLHRRAVFELSKRKLVLDNKNESNFAPIRFFPYRNWNERLSQNFSSLLQVPFQQRLAIQIQNVKRITAKKHQLTFQKHKNQPAHRMTATSMSWASTFFFLLVAKI
jgi:hypothetical protein